MCNCGSMTFAHKTYRTGQWSLGIRVTNRRWGQVVDVANSILCTPEGGDTKIVQSEDGMPRLSQYALGASYTNYIHYGSRKIATNSPTMTKFLVDSWNNCGFLWLSPLAANLICDCPKWPSRVGQCAKLDLVINVRIYERKQSSERVLFMTSK